MKFPENTHLVAIGIVNKNCNIATKTSAVLKILFDYLTTASFNTGQNVTLSNLKCSYFSMRQ